MREAEHDRKVEYDEPASTGNKIKRFETQMTQRYCLHPKGLEKQIKSV